MKIVVAATDLQWDELNGNELGPDCIRLHDAAAFSGHTDADAFLNLLGNTDMPAYAAWAKPVIIDSVIQTLEDLEAPENVLRINGWTGFIKRPLWEIAGKINSLVESFAGQLNKKILSVADEPGLIAAGIVSMIINEAYFALGDGVSGKSEIDTAMKLGTSYPYGPFEWADSIGPEKVLALLHKLNSTDKRYQPAAGLIREVSRLHP